MNALRQSLRLAWHVFRGRPLMYRIRVVDGEVTFARGERALIHSSVSKRSGKVLDIVNDQAAVDLIEKGEIRVYASPAVPIEATYEVFNVDVLGQEEPTDE